MGSLLAVYYWNTGRDVLPTRRRRRSAVAQASQSVRLDELVIIDLIEEETQPVGDTYYLHSLNLLNYLSMVNFIGFCFTPVFAFLDLACIMSSYALSTSVGQDTPLISLKMSPFLNPRRNPSPSVSGSILMSFLSITISKSHGWSRGIGKLNDFLPWHSA